MNLMGSRRRWTALGVLMVFSAGSTLIGPSQSVSADPGPTKPTQVQVVNTAANPARVDGTVSVKNLPTVQVVSGSVAVSNLPSTQQVAGSVEVTNLPDVQKVQVVNPTVATDVNVANFPATQLVNGKVAIDELSGGLYLHTFSNISPPILPSVRLDGVLPDRPLRIDVAVMVEIAQDPTVPPDPVVIDLTVIDPTSQAVFFYEFPTSSSFLNGGQRRFTGRLGDPIVVPAGARLSLTAATGRVDGVSWQLVMSVNGVYLQ